MQHLIWPGGVGKLDWGVISRRGGHFFLWIPAAKSPTPQVIINERSLNKHDVDHFFTTINPGVFPLPSNLFPGIAVTLPYPVCIILKQTVVYSYIMHVSLRAGHCLLKAAEKCDHL